ncbi:MAG: GNAT family N-acetyltransferase [Planctomycetales bacterium]|nr:GNAT family N-acetyltransferase [Planctomycetales bacterium]
MHSPSPEEARLVADRSAGRLGDLGAGVEIVAATPGDHPEALALLAQTQQAQLAEDFQSRLDEPGYSPADRLLIRRRGQLVGHVRSSRHIAWFSGQRIPVGRIDDLALLPEYAAAGYDDALLATAEESAAREGALVLTAFAADAAPFRRRGWSRVRGQGHTRARTRAVLAHLDALQEHRRRRRRAEAEVRAWRLVDLDAIEQIFARMAPATWGALLRSPETWRWLAGRKVHDAILLALQGGRRNGGDDVADDLPTPPEQVVGYAVLRDSQVIEMFTDPARPAAATALLAQACRDAIDRGHHFVSLHTPADDPLHELIVTAGGGWAAHPAEGQWMTKLAAPDRWVDRMYPVLRERAVAAGIDRPAEIAMRVGDAVRALVLTRRSARLEHRNADESSPFPCSAVTEQDLLLGNLSLSRGLHDRLLPELAPETARLVAGLLPARQFWQSPWELLRL